MNRKLFASFCFILTSFLSNAGQHKSEIQYQKPNLLFRSSPSDGENIDFGIMISNKKMQINNQGDFVAIADTFKNIDQNNLVLGNVNNHKNTVIYSTERPENIFNDPYLDPELPIVLISEFNEFQTEFITKYTPRDKQNINFMPKDGLFISNLSFNKNTNFWRTNHNSKFSFKTNDQVIIPETYYVTMTAVKNDVFAYKKIDENFIETLHLYKSKNDHMIDTANSKYRFTNFLSINSKGQVAAMINENGTKKIVIYNEEQKLVCAEENFNNLTEIEFFHIKINENGNVVFRAKNEKYKRGVYLCNKDQVTLVYGEDDLVVTNKGITYIKSAQGPTLIGSPDINDNNEIVFATYLSFDKEGKQYAGNALLYLSPLMD